MDKDLSTLRPFDLTKAKEGVAICTRSGEAARFVRHVPELSPFSVITLYMGAQLLTHSEDGLLGFTENPVDLMMAPLTWVEGTAIYEGDTVCMPWLDMPAELVTVVATDHTMVRIMRPNGEKRAVWADSLTLKKPKTKREGWIVLNLDPSVRVKCYVAGVLALPRIFPTRELAEVSCPGLPIIHAEWEE
jgi:hypothetical protein